MRALPLLVLLGVVAFGNAAGARAPLGSFERSSARAQAHQKPADEDGGVSFVFVLGTLGLIGLGMLFLKIRSQGDVGALLTGSPPPTFEDPWEANLAPVLPGIAEGWVDTLRREDPAFDPQALLARVGETYRRMEEALFLRDLAPVRSLLSDATYQRLKTRLALDADAGLREAITDVRVAGAQLVGYVRADPFETLHVAVDVRLRQKLVPSDTPDADARRLAAAEYASTFTEVCSFVRLRGCKSGAANLLQGKCPNCGAPFPGAQSNVCAFCRVVVNSGNYDWTLFELTDARDQVEALRDSEIKGLSQARAADPALTLQILEDRASLIFWKWLEMDALREPRRLSKLADAHWLSTHVPGEPRRFRGLGVRGVDTQSFHVDPKGQWALVEVRWHAQVAPRALSPGEAPVWRGTRCRTRLALVRGAHAQTRIDNGLSTSRCPGCNAPLSDSLEATCEFCHHAFGAPDDDWVLAGEDTDELNG